MYDLETASIILKTQVFLFFYLLFCVFFAVGWYLVSGFLCRLRVGRENLK